MDYRTHKERVYDHETQREALQWRFRVHQRVLKLRPPIDWKRSPYGSKAFNARLAELVFLDQLLYVYVASPDFKRPKKRRALRMARNIVLHWVRREEQGKVNSETWTDRPAARRALFVAYVARAAACERMLRRRDARRLLISIREHGRFLRNPAIYRDTNHGLSVDLGLAALGYYLGLPRSERAIVRGAKLGARRYKRTFFRSYHPEGVWLEHSMGYYRHAISLIDRYLRIADPRAAALRSARDAMLTALAWLTAPDGRMAQFGDTNRAKPMEEAATRAAGQGGLWVAPGAGYAVVKDLNAGGWLAIASSYHSGVHKHSDELTFELHESGRRIVQDTGQYHKDRDRYFYFQRSPAAHSTLVIDSEQLDSEDFPPYGSGIYAWGAGDGWYAVWANNPIAGHRGVYHARLFLYKPGYALLVADAVDSNVLRAYRRYFQIASGIRVADEDGTLLLRRGSFEGALSSYSTAGQGTLQTVSGQEEPLAGWYFPRFRERKPRVTASWRTVGQSVDHLATFSLDGPALSAELATGLGDDITIALTEEVEGIAGEPEFNETKLRVIRADNKVTVDETP